MENILLITVYSDFLDIGQRDEELELFSLSIPSYSVGIHKKGPTKLMKDMNSIASELQATPSESKADPSEHWPCQVDKPKKKITKR